MSHAGETKETYTYIAPMEGQEHILPEYTATHPAGIQSAQYIVHLRPGAQVLGTMVLPYTDPADPTKYASIHNNPPGVPTDHPSIVLNQYGEGKGEECVHHDQRQFCVQQSQCLDDQVEGNDQS